MTNATNQCPEPVQLKKFVLGELSLQEVEDYQQHLSQCDPCVETIESLKVDDTFTGIARQAFQNELTTSQDEQSAVEDMIRRASSWSRSEAAGQSLPQAAIEMDRSAEVHRLLREPIEPEDIGAIAHYRIQHLLGTGSTGVVYLALDTKLDRQVVLKLLRPSLGEAARKRFVAEGRATAKLDHQNIVTIYEVGSDGPLSYLAMQWLPGKTLDEKLQHEEALPVAQTRELARQLTSGLQAAHSRELIHRDIKPANIWIPDGDGQAKILDFGLVRIADEDPQLTCTGMIAGTPCFMSPEQSRGDSIDRRSDLFSLGCVMYQCLTGRLPFRSDNALATLRSIQQDQPTQPHELDPAIDTATSDLVMCLLEKSPSRRPSDANEVMTALNSDPEDWAFEYEPQTQNQSLRKRTGSGFWKALAAMLFGIALGAFALAYGQQILRVVTNQGVIEIDTKVDDVKIEIVDGGKVVKVVDLATEQSIEIKSGEYEIRPVSDKNSISVDKTSLVLSRGETEIVRISQKSDSVANTAASSLLGQQDDSLLEQMGLSGGPYRLRPGDVLGVFIDGLIGSFDSDPPVHYPNDGRTPVIGFPIAIEHDGNISIPILGDVQVSTLTVPQARKKLINACTKNPRPDGHGPLLQGNARVMLNLIRQTGEKASFTGSNTANKRSNALSTTVVKGPSSKGRSSTVDTPAGESRANVRQGHLSFGTSSNRNTSETSPLEAPVPQQSNGSHVETIKNFIPGGSVTFGPSHSMTVLPIPAKNQHEQAQSRIDELKKLREETPDDPLIAMQLLSAKVELQQLKAFRFGNDNPEPLRQIVQLREQQLELIDKNSSSKDLADRKKIRYQLGVARNSLHAFEKEHRILPYTQLVYENNIYEHWYQIAKQERQTEKLTKAMLSMANLAGDTERDEMLEIILQIARRGPGVTTNILAHEFRQTVLQVLGMQDADTFVQILVDEMARNRECEMVSSAYSEILKRKLNVNSDRNMDLAVQLTDALLKYATEYGEIKSTFDLFFRGCQQQLENGLANNEAAKTLVELYLDKVLSSVVLSSRVASVNIRGGGGHLSSLPIEVSHYSRIARLFPDSKGLEALIKNDINSVNEIANKLRKAGSSDDKAVAFIAGLLNVINELPEKNQPKQLLVDCVNEDLQFFDDTRRQLLGSGDWAGTYSASITSFLEIGSLEFLQKLDAHKHGSLVKLELEDGVVQIQEKKKTTPSDD